MITLNVLDRFYQVAFRHVRTSGPNPTLARRVPIEAITTCVIIAMEPGGPVKINETLSVEPWEIAFVAIDNAVCERGDAFSRAKGRHSAFIKAVQRCGALRDVRMALIAAYLERDPGPHEQKLRKPKLDAQARTERWQAGWEKRKEREAPTAQGART